MLLHRVRIIGSERLKDIRIRNGKIQEIASAGSLTGDAETGLSLDQALVFPGLINSHDHLDFNLFPRLGNRIYNNYREWGKDIHTANQAGIASVLRIPRALRIRWGIYKNLLNGITTVVNHGKLLSIPDPLITIYQGSRCLHSPGFERNWKLKINIPHTGRRPFAMHLGEGTDELSHREIDSLIRWNIFKRKVVAIHGVAMNPEQAAAFHALVWCPASNYFLLNKTAAVNELGRQVNIMLGTDSTLTASWNLWEHLRMARKEKMVPDRELLDMITLIPAKVWGLDDCGRIAEGCRADLVVAAGKNATDTMHHFFSLNPNDLLLLVHHGHVRMFDASLLTRIEGPGFDIGRFSKISVNGRLKYVEGDLPGLMNRIAEYYPAVRFPVSLS
jgi:cytosine/adenosine deaminase-related metal-dependent hydrolase